MRVHGRVGVRLVDQQALRVGAGLIARERRDGLGSGEAPEGELEQAEVAELSGIRGRRRKPALDGGAAVGGDGVYAPPPPSGLL